MVWYGMVPLLPPGPQSWRPGGGSWIGGRLSVLRRSPGSDETMQYIHDLPLLLNFDKELERTTDAMRRRCRATR
jgi:hypothetical protein